MLTPQKVAPQTVSAWAINPNQLSVKIRYWEVRVVDPHSLPVKVGINGADNNARVRRVLIVQTDKVFSVECQNRSIFRER